MNRAVIVDGYRTGVGRGNYTGGLISVDVHDFTAEVLKAVVEKTDLDVKTVDEVILGNIYEYDQCFARYTLLRAGFPVEVPGFSIDRNCGSGLTAINCAAANIIADIGDIYIAGGGESMGRGYWLVERTPVGYQRAHPGFKTPVGGMIGAPPEYKAGSMVETADRVAIEYNVPRKEQEECAYQSHQKAAAAHDAGYYKEEIIPIKVPRRKQEPLIFETDECIRRDINLEKMAKLQVLSRHMEGATVTAATACPINDGAGAVLIMSEEKAKALGYKPRLYVKSIAAAGVHPNVMGVGPIEAVRKAVKKAGLEMKDIGAMEFNEAFASQVIACIRAWENDGLDPTVVNVDGGGIAIGHAIALTGARLPIHLMHVMERLDKQFGVVTMCVGGGQGVATVFERV